MQARRASRELALILFSQLGKDLDKYQSTDFKDIVLNSVRTLIGNSQDELQLVTSELNEIKEFILEYENNHMDNLERPLDAVNIPVKVPMTDDMAEKISTTFAKIPLINDGDSSVEYFFASSSASSITTLTGASLT